MKKNGEAFVGIDTAKARNAVAIAEGGRTGEIRYLGELDATPAAVAKLVRKLTSCYETLQFCYEAGPTGYVLYRQILSLGHGCVVAAPSLIPRRPGDRVKTNRRDAQSLEQIDERRDTMLAIVLGRRQRFIGVTGRLQVRPLCWNEGTAAVRKRDEQELNAAPS